MHKEINGCVILEKQGNDLSITARNLSMADAVTLSLFSIVSIVKSSGIELERIHQMIDCIDQSLEVEECRHHEGDRNEATRNYRFLCGKWL